VAGCAAPENHYVAEKPGTAPAGSVYFTVPHTWTAFPAAAITAAEHGWSDDAATKSVLDATAWQEAFDAAPDPSLVHVLGTATSDRPTVYASLRSLYAAETGTASTDALRDLVVPVSTLGSAVRVVTDEKVHQGATEGIHLVLAYSPGAGLPEETIDQTAYLSDGNDAVYLLVVRCSTACYGAHTDQIRSVTSSYTIQGDSSG
jgi:hypothetical protein